jgi:hypothetical protein
LGEKGEKILRVLDDRVPNDIFHIIIAEMVGKGVGEEKEVQKYENIDLSAHILPEWRTSIRGDRRIIRM